MRLNNHDFLEVRFYLFLSFFGLIFFAFHPNLSEIKAKGIVVFIDSLFYQLSAYPTFTILYFISPLILAVLVILLLVFLRKFTLNLCSKLIVSLILMLFIIISIGYILHGSLLWVFAAGFPLAAAWVAIKSKIKKIGCK